MQNKCFNRIVSFLLAFLLVVPMLQPLGVFAADGVTVYLDPVNGDDGNTGLTEESPVKSIESAYALLQTAGGTVVFLDTLELDLTAATSFPACSYPVTLTSKTGAEGIAANYGITFLGETKLENITMTLTRDSVGAYLQGNGKPFTIGENVTSLGTLSEDGTDLCYFCLGATGIAASGAQLTVRSGNWRNIYGAYTRTINGNLVMDISNCTAARVSATYNGTVTGTVSISLSDIDIAYTVDGNSANTGDVTGDTTLVLGDNVTVPNVYAGNRKSGNTVSENITVILDGENHNISNIYGKYSGGDDMNSILIAKRGTLAKTPIAFDTVQINVAQGKSLTLQDEVTANSVTCAGTLYFDGVAALNAEAVTGTVNCQIIGKALKNNVYATAPTGSDIVFPAESGIVENDGKWLNHDLVNFEGLVLTAPSAASVKLYEKLFVQDSTFTQVTPYHTETVDDVSYYYFPNISGNYHYLASRSGYYTIYKNIYMSDAEAASKTVTAVDLKKKTGEGWEPNVVYSQSDEVLDTALSCDPSLWEDYAEYLDVPSITENAGTHQMTTQAQMVEYIDGLVADTDHMYVYSVGKGGKQGYDIPAVIYTARDLSAVTTLEAAAAELAKDDKATVLYRAQMHGNEPGGGEGALAMLQKLCDTYGASLLDTMNVVVIPRVSPDSSYSFSRYYADTGINPNRDQLRLQSSEMQAYQAAYLLFQPHVVIDGHERVWNNQGGDITLTPSFSIMNSEAFIDKSLDIVHAAFDELEQEGLAGYYYSNYLNERDYSSGYGYTGAVGAFYVLAETRGIYSGNEFMERRMVSHMVTVTGILDYVKENADTIKSMVAQEKARIATNGATYDETEIIPLDLDKRNEPNYTRLSQYVNWATGEVTFKESTPRIFDKILRSRSMPTAYVLPADQNNIEAVLELLDRHDISYKLLPAGATLTLQQYTGTVDEATLSVEKSVGFAQGAYVFTMNQSTGLILALLMEPDVTDIADYSSTLAQQGLVAVTDIYRYAQDLNDEGTVDYTISDLEDLKQKATVYVAAASGSDTNDGLTEETPVATFEKAYAILTETFGTNTDAVGTIVVLEDYLLSDSGIYNFPSHSYEVVITGKTDSVRLNYYGGSGQTTRQVNFYGPTVLDDITIAITQSGNYFHMNANGNKFVVGDNVTTVKNASGKYFYLAAGGYSTSVSSTDMTIKSGTWQAVYAGGRGAAVTGQAKLTMTGGTVLTQVLASYNGTCGSVIMDISNVVVNTSDAKNGIYAGLATSNAVTGDVTITLGENVNSPVFGSSRDSGNINGTVMIIIDGADMTQTVVNALSGTTGTVNESVLVVKSGTAAAVADFDEVNLDTSAGGTVTLATDMTFDNVTGGDGVLDLNGKSITSAFAVDGGMLRIKDSQTDDYDVSDGKYGKIPANVTNVVAADGYMMATEDDGVSFHKVDTEIDYAIFSPTKAGLYYSSLFKGDAVVKENVKAFGVALSITGEPTVDSNGFADHCLYSVFGKDEFEAGNEKEFASTILRDILSEEYSPFTNKRNAETKVYGRSYIQLEDGTYILGESTSITLQEAIVYTDSVWDQLETIQQDAVLDLYERFPAVFNTWDIPTIKEMAEK